MSVVERVARPIRKGERVQASGRTGTVLGVYLMQGFARVRWDDDHSSGPAAKVALGTLSRTTP